MTDGLSQEPEKKKVEFYWWHGKDLKDFFAEVANLGLENVRVSFNPTTRLLKILPEWGDLDNGGTTYNASHICPPDCGS